MTINDLEFLVVEIEAELPERAVRSVVLRLATDEGVEGWGEANLPWRASELEARRRALLVQLVGRSVFDIEELIGLEELADGALRSAVEMACWDLIGRAADLPLCQLWGGTYRQRLPVSVRLAGDDSQPLALRARELADQGFYRQLIPSVGSVDDDVARLAAVRQAAGERVQLALDAAKGYDIQQARDLCQQLEDSPPEYVLDPLASDAPDQLASLCRQTTVPLATCRAIRSPRDVLALFQCGATAKLILDLQRLGGISAVRKSAAVAEAGGLSATLNPGRSLGLQMAAAVQLAASHRPIVHLCDATFHHLADDLLLRPPDITDGLLSVPLAPGLGVEVDRENLERYQID